MVCFFFLTAFRLLRYKVVKEQGGKEQDILNHIHLALNDFLLVSLSFMYNTLMQVLLRS